MLLPGLPTRYRRLGSIASTLTALVALVLVPARATAQQPDSARAKVDSMLMLVPIEVVGSIQPSAGPNVISNIPARVTILGAKEVDQYEPRILSEVMAQQAGFSTYDDLGSPYKLNIQSRGFFSSPVVGLPQGLTVFLDGVRQNEADAAQVNFDLLPMQYVHRVELLSGTASLLGRNSLGGSINLVTPRGDGPLGGELEVQGGMWGTYGANGSVSGGKPGGLDFFAAGTYNHETGWRQGTDARQYSGFFNAGKLTSDWGIRLQGLASWSNAETAGSLPLSVYEANPDSNMTVGDYEDLDLLQFVASGYKQLGLGRGSFRAWVRNSNADRFNVNQQDDADALGNSSNLTLGLNLDYRWTKQVGSSLLSLRGGFEGTDNDATIDIYADSAKFGGSTALTTSVESPLWDIAFYVAGDVTAGPATFSIGGRYDYVRIPFQNQLDPTNDTTSNFSRFSPKGGVSVDLGHGASVYGSIGTGFRAPALIEVACADPERPCLLPFALGDDPPIEPVTTTTYEIGGRWLTGQLSVGGSAYLSNVSNDIFLFPSENEVSGSTIEGYFANLDKTRRAGVELTAGYAFGKHSVYANYAYTNATFQSEATIFSILGQEGLDNTVQAGDKLPLVPSQQVKFGATFQLPARITLGGDVRYIGSQYLRGDEANQTPPLDPYWVVDLRATWQIGRVEVSALLTNLFDSKYASFGTYNVNQGNPNGPTLEPFLSPGQPTYFRLVARYAFGGHGLGSGGVDLD